MRDFYREPTQVGGVTRPLCNAEDKSGGVSGVLAGNNPFQAAFERYLFVAWARAATSPGIPVLVAFAPEDVMDGLADREDVGPVGETG